MSFVFLIKLTVFEEHLHLDSNPIQCSVGLFFFPTKSMVFARQDLTETQLINSLIFWKNSATLVDQTFRCLFKPLENSKVYNFVLHFNLLSKYVPAGNAHVFIWGQTRAEPILRPRFSSANTAESIDADFSQYKCP